MCIRFGSNKLKFVDFDLIIILTIKNIYENNKFLYKI